MKQLQTVAVAAGAGVLGVMLLAALLQPLLPWLFALFLLACVLRIATGNS